MKGCWWLAVLPDLQGGKDILFHNNGDGTFTDVSEKAGILKKQGTYGLGVLVGDFDNDGWPDIYVADDSAPSALFKNNHDGTFSDIALEAGVAFGADGKTQAGMGVTAADASAMAGWRSSKRILRATLRRSIAIWATTILKT